MASLYLYLDRGTFVHRLHPVVRLLGMAALFVAAFVVERPLAQVPLLCLLVPVAVHTGAVRNLHRLRLLFFLIFTTTLLIWTLFYGPDGEPPLFQWRGWEVSRTAPRFALGMAMKLDILLGCGILFLSVTRIEEFAYALHRLGVPYKVGFTFSLAFRLVPVFLDAAGAVVQAQRCRGLDFDRGGLIERLARYIPVIVPVFMTALRRADTMAMALEARGFQSAAARTTLQRHVFRGADAVALLFAAALAAAYLALWTRGDLSIG
jgi:energy-coupling factor transport system permease protein